MLLLQPRTAQIEIAIFQTDVLADIASVAAHVKWRRFRLVQNGRWKVSQVRYRHSAFLPEYFFPDRLLILPVTSTTHSGRSFAPTSCAFVAFGKMTPCTYPRHIAKIKKDELALIAADINPAHDRHLFAHVSGQIPYIYSFVHIVMLILIQC